MLRSSQSTARISNANHPKIPNPDAVNFTKKPGITRNNNIIPLFPSDAVKFTKKSGINRAIMGQVPENVDEADCILVADVEGVLVKLMPIDKEAITNYEAYRRRMERR
jgi:hypothetical protein